MFIKGKQNVGRLGEDIACKFLMKQGFEIIERNYLKKWGEIDIIALKDSRISFIEVKTVSCESVLTFEFKNPEENVHSSKIKRLGRIIQTYLTSHKISKETSWQLDILAIFVIIDKSKVRIRWTKNIVIPN